MSFFNDINGLNANALKSIQATTDENKEDFSEVDFCVNDYDGEIFGATFQDGNGNGVSDEAEFYTEIGGNGYDEIGGNGYAEIGGNGYDEIDEADSAYMSAAIQNYMENYDVTEEEAEEHFDSMNFEG